MPALTPTPVSSRAIAAATALACAFGSSCAALPRPVELPAPDAGATLIVASAALGEPLDDVARHPWVAFREDGARRWMRYEVMCCAPDTVRGRPHDPLSDYGAGGGDVQIHKVLTGQDARDAIACVERAASDYPYNDLYRAWPGPNSNTFVDYLARTCGLGVELPATSIGRDFRGWVGVSTTAGGTGVQLETPLVGLKVGLTEGVELHILALVIGVDLWPPALILPVGDGRLGFADR